MQGLGLLLDFSTALRSGRKDKRRAAAVERTKEGRAGRKDNVVIPSPFGIAWARSFVTPSAVEGSGYGRGAHLVCSRISPLRFAAVEMTKRGRSGRKDKRRAAAVERTKEGRAGRKDNVVIPSPFGIAWARSFVTPSAVEGSGYGRGAHLVCSRISPLRFAAVEMTKGGALGSK